MSVKTLQGVVVSIKNKDTVTLEVERTFVCRKYNKIITKSKKYTAHDPKGICKENQTIKIISSRPISLQKRWTVVY